MIIPSISTVLDGIGWVIAPVKNTLKNNKRVGWLASDSMSIFCLSIRVFVGYSEIVPLHAVSGIEFEGLSHTLLIMPNFVLLG